MKPLLPVETGEPPAEDEQKLLHPEIVIASPPLASHVVLIAGMHDGHEVMEDIGVVVPAPEEEPDKVTPDVSGAELPLMSVLVKVTVPEPAIPPAKVAGEVLLITDVLVNEKLTPSENIPPPPSDADEFPLIRTLLNVTGVVPFSK